MSDPHLPMPAWSPAAIAGKRVLGFMSWHRRRKRIHLPDVLRLLVADIQAHRPDHIAVTGDLANIALPEEFRGAAAWLESLGPPRDVTVVPGNHDAYVSVHPSGGWDLWSAYMAGDNVGAELFPAVRERAPIGLVGLSSALPMPWLSAAGRLGEPQVRPLPGLLSALGQRGLFRVVLLHHPPVPVPGVGRRKALLDAAAFAEAVRAGGAELILHGHSHRSSLGKVETAKGYAAVVGVPSASAARHAGREAAQWHLYRIESSGDHWEVEVTVRGLGPEASRFVTEAQYALRFPRAQ